MLGIVFLYVPVVAFVAIYLVHLNRCCRALQRQKEAWKAYALAIEALYECDLDRNAATTNRERLKAERQQQNAEKAAMDAGRMLHTLGEYPEIYGCSPFLPADSRLHDWCRSQIR